jgi:hypothetical protein
LRLTADLVVFQDMRTLASLLTNWRNNCLHRKTARSLAVLAGPNEVGFATHLYQSREYRRTSERAKSGKRIERCGISTFQIAQSLATVASFAIGNTASGLENDREWSRGPNFDPYAVARTSALSPGKLRAVRPRSKLSPVVKSPLRRSTPIFRCSCRAELIGIK